MQLSDLPGKFIGLTGDQVAISAHRAAYSDAVAICAFAGSQYFPNLAILAEVQRQFIERISSFAINARRVTEILNLRGIEITGARWGIAVPVVDLRSENNFWDAINKIVHARHLQVLVIERPSKLFLNNIIEWILTYLEVQSDRGEKIHVDPFGLAFAYIDETSNNQTLTLPDANSSLRRTGLA